MIGIMFLVLGFTMLPIYYTARVKIESKIGEVSNRLNALTTRITEIRKYSLDRNDIELVAHEIEEASEMLAEIRQLNKHPFLQKPIAYFLFWANYYR